jgi:hypothetical protein
MKLIVEMEMPQACPCEFADYSSHGIFRPCFAWNGIPARWSEVEKCAENGTRPDWCPIKGILPDEHGLEDMIDAVIEQPTVDAVPAVRCEKCSHGIKNHGISDGWVLCTKPYVTDTVGAMMHPNDWFCADGERRSDE